MVFAPSIRYPRLLEISHKNGICSLFTGKYNFRDVLGWGICTLFLTPTVGFCMNAWPHPGHLHLFQNKMTNSSQMPGGRGGWGRLELTEP